VGGDGAVEWIEVDRWMLGYLFTSLIALDAGEL
jgi:hypothetical protein